MVVCCCASADVVQHSKYLPSYCVHTVRASRRERTQLLKGHLANVVLCAFHFQAVQGKP